MDWKNINLSDRYEREQNIIDPLDFDTLLLEISCNIRDINKYTIREQFEIDLKARVESAKEVFENNLNNILIDAVKYRDTV